MREREVTSGVNRSISRNRALEAILEPITVQQFIEDVWDQRQLVLSRNDPDFYTDLFCFKDVDRLIFLARDRPQELLTIMPKHRSDTQIKTRLDKFPVQEIYRRFSAGDTIRISSLENSWPPLLPLVRGIAQALGAKVDVNVYMTPADSQGFPTHVDHEDVFILQVGGSKEWFIYQADYPWPLENLSYVEEQGGFRTGRRDATSLRLIERVVLERGDFLYIPRGFPHHAITSGLPSLHLTIGIHPTYYLDLVRAALEVASEDEPALRRALPPGTRDSEIWATIVPELEQMLGRILKKSVLERALQVVTAKHLPPPDFPPDGHFASLASLGALTVTSTVERREGLDCLIESDEEGGVVIHFGRAHVKGPISIRPALEYIRDHSAFRVADLPGLSDTNGSVVLTRRLVREGLLRILTA